MVSGNTKTRGLKRLLRGKGAFPQDHRVTLFSREQAVNYLREKGLSLGRIQIAGNWTPAHNQKGTELTGSVPLVEAWRSGLTRRFYKSLGSGFNGAGSRGFESHRLRSPLKK